MKDSLIFVTLLFVSLLNVNSYKNVLSYKLRRLSLSTSSSSMITETETDVVIIGSGIGGLCSAALLAKAGKSVVVCEAHYELGGCAHEFAMTEDGRVIPTDTTSSDPVYKFEAGPSLYSGLSQYRSANPLKHVFQMIDEEPEWITYSLWTGFFPEAPEGFKQSVGAVAFEDTLMKYGGPNALKEWKILVSALRPLAEGVMELPTVAIRPDVGALRTIVFPYLIPLFKTIMQGEKLTRPFSQYYEELEITDQFLKNYLNLLCFLLQGLPDTGTSSAVMAYMIDDLFKPNGVLDYPKDGSAGIINALERGILKNGGIIKRRTRVDSIIVDDDNRCTGVKTAREIIKAKEAVVSNADLWTTFNLIPKTTNKKFEEEREDLLKNAPLCKSFCHLHLGIESEGLPADLPPQWTVCNDWNKPIDSDFNVIVVSMPSILDPTLAPTGRHVIHAYYAGSEPYEIWEGLDRKSEEYVQKKKERAEALWKAVEKVIPDVRTRVKLELIGTPLTHERFNRRYRGTYGPAFAGGRGFPGQKTHLKALYRCGDSTNPGIGVPSVAASGAMAAGAILSTEEHLELLKKIRMP